MSPFPTQCIRFRGIWYPVNRTNSSQGITNTSHNRGFHTPPQFINVRVAPRNRELFFWCFREICGDLSTSGKVRKTLSAIMSLCRLCLPRRNDGDDSFSTGWHPDRSGSGRLFTRHRTRSSQIPVITNLAPNVLDVVC